MPTFRVQPDDPNAPALDTLTATDIRDAVAQAVKRWPGQTLRIVAADGEAVVRVVQ
ncbi:hypothetical protein 2B_00035 [Ralstonia phage Bakoly]|uniref:Uncharacterized protein n=2 Tax=Bakolyvirus bakoly TaxID=2846039 RepID=A0A7G5BB62_9CAUD|nr:hypothetical protein KE333_gp35 [Ralstonia phage Bakoly]QMV32608.1 hypothetical protein 2B_00035 [Ralstonia phage Bakoly]QMV33535.1 hypothetical protein 30B_00028 [Ralstonia phage Jenny]